MSAHAYSITFRWLWVRNWRGSIVMAYRFEHEPANVVRLAWENA